MQRSRIAALLTLVLAVSYAGTSFADARTEKEAKDLRQKAIEEDSLGLQYEAAITKLTQALAKCGANNCSAQLRAQLNMDMGAMIFANSKNDRPKALESFVAAAKIDATLALSRDYRTAELDELWGEAKKRAGGGGTTEPGPSNAEWDHTPPTEQQANTPLPIYLKYKGAEKIAKVLVRYKGAQMGGLESAPLTKKDDGGWGGLIPCKDVAEGTFQYYIRAENDAGDQVKLGDPDHMFKVAIKGSSVDNPPSLPGEAPPKPCACPPDAPPDFPGCQKKDDGPTGKDEGADCDENSECKSKECKKHQCTAPEGGGSSSKFRRVWVGISGTIDMDLLPGADDVCKLSDPQAQPINSAGYYCVDPNAGNSDYPSRSNGMQNSGIVQGKSDQVKGGFALGNIRIALSVDYALSEHFLLGARLGFVVNTYPGAAAGNDAKGFTSAPIHGEVRGTYLLGQDPLSKGGLAPMFFLGAGIGEFDARVPVTVVDSSGSHSVDAWLPNGPIFASLGGGIRYGFGRAAFVGALKATTAFGSNGMLFGVAPELGLQLGF